MDHTYPKVILAVLDGFGIASPSSGNAISSADPDVFKSLIASYPVKVLQASGPAVGLPWGERGNSEVGHLNIGAGRVVVQELARINKAVADGSFYNNTAINEAMDKTQQGGGSLHLIGLIGTGGVHAYEQHLYSLYGMALDKGLESIVIHVFTDGRDAPVKAAIESVAKLEAKLKETGVGHVATVTGRFYAMDRGGHIEQTAATLDAIIRGRGEKFASAQDAVSQRYDHGITDEMIPPSIIGTQESVVKRGDSAIFFNFRNDRVIQLTRMFLDQTEGVFVTTLTSYDPELDVQVAFPPLEIKSSLGEVVSSQNWKQFHAAESEKFAHVTFFFNGHRHEPWPGEERMIVKSPVSNTNNYEDVPEMSADELTDVVVRRIREHDDKFVLVNYANGDMVGHTGNLAAAMKAVRKLDESLGKLAEVALETKSLLIITADHGNCEMMLDLHSGNALTEHSDNPVPIIFCAEDLRGLGQGFTISTLSGELPSGILPDIAPTILKALGLEVPVEMTGNVIDFA